MFSKIFRAIARTGEAVPDAHDLVKCRTIACIDFVYWIPWCAFNEYVFVNIFGKQVFSASWDIRRRIERS
jgi:hypothetical protein